MPEGKSNMDSESYDVKFEEDGETIEVNGIRHEVHPDVFDAFYAFAVEQIIDYGTDETQH